MHARTRDHIVSIIRVSINRRRIHFDGLYIIIVFELYNNIILYAYNILTSALLIIASHITLLIIASHLIH